MFEYFDTPYSLSKKPKLIHIFHFPGFVYCWNWDKLKYNRMGDDWANTQSKYHAKAPWRTQRKYWTNRKPRRSWNPGNSILTICSERNNEASPSSTFSSSPQNGDQCKIQRLYNSEEYSNNNQRLGHCPKLWFLEKSNSFQSREVLELWYRLQRSIF